MTANWGVSPISRGTNSGRILDTARGILIGLRRCPSELALDELHSAAQRHGVSLFEISWALVHLAVDNGTTCQSFLEAQVAARREWGELLVDSAMAVC
ncbi:ANTAR domain-containing protein [Mycobacterium spongiae]|uniref:ANTAR domain-containing protein n=1 Tax=Mycobacterium spongiae TaxID=886343 RepID=UPI001FE547D7|nr:ANTAR domain-containing protein [Mycobacterium spongiae]